MLKEPTELMERIKPIKPIIIMSDTVIKVENLSKQYRIGAKEGYKTFRKIK